MATATISAKYLPLLSAARAGKGEIRSMLQGIFIEPHPTKGAYLVATDGHRIAVVYDESATADFPLLIDPDKNVVRASPSADLAKFDGKQCVLTNGEEIVLVGQAPLADGIFPNWKAVIPSGEDKLVPASFNPELMKLLLLAPYENRYKCATLYTFGNSGAIVRFPLLPQTMLVVMPMRMEQRKPRPDWLPPYIKPEKKAA